MASLLKNQVALVHIFSEVRAGLFNWIRCQLFLSRIRRIKCLLSVSGWYGSKWPRKWLSTVGIMTKQPNSWLRSKFDLSPNVLVNEENLIKLLIFFENRISATAYPKTKSAGGQVQELHCKMCCFIIPATRHSKPFEEEQKLKIVSQWHWNKMNESGVNLQEKTSQRHFPLLFKDQNCFLENVQLFIVNKHYVTHLRTWRVTDFNLQFPKNVWQGESYRNGMWFWYFRFLHKMICCTFLFNILRASGTCYQMQLQTDDIYSEQFC